MAGAELCDTRSRMEAAPQMRDPMQRLAFAKVDLCDDGRSGQPRMRFRDAYCIAFCGPAECIRASVRSLIDLKLTKPADPASR